MESPEKIEDIEKSCQETPTLTKVAYLWRVYIRRGEFAKARLLLADSQWWDLVEAFVEANDPTVSESPSGKGRDVWKASYNAFMRWLLLQGLDNYILYGFWAMLGWWCERHERMNLQSHGRGYTRITENDFVYRLSASIPSDWMLVAAPILATMGVVTVAMDGRFRPGPMSPDLPTEDDMQRMITETLEIMGGRDDHSGRSTEARRCLP